MNFVVVGIDVYFGKYENIFFCVDLHDGLLMVLSVVGLLSSQALAMLSVLFASEVMPTVIR